MSDLISRSQLLKEIETWGGCVEALHEYIQNMPTAYDVDKVVEELEERKALHERLVEYENKNGTVTEKYQHIKAIDVLNDAIEIVNQGGIGTETETIRDKAVKWNNNSSKRVPYEFIDYVEGKREIGASDDVCEWHKVKSNIYKCYTHAETYDSRVLDWCKCPYCSKKIKIVGD